MSEDRFDLVHRLRTMGNSGWNPIGNEAADSIIALEAKVRELEAERDAHHSNYKFMQRCAEENNAKLTASRQQVERLVEAIDCFYRMLISEADTRRALFKAENILREALAAVEKERWNEQAKGPRSGPA